MRSGPRVYVVAPVHNRRETTQKFIQCLLAQAYADWHLLLVDDGSQDGTAEMARALVPAPSLTILQGTGNWWWAGSLHQAYLWLKRAKVPNGDIVVTMNDDTDFDPDFLGNAVKALNPRSLMLAQLYNMKDVFEEVGVRWDWKDLLCHSVTDGNDFNCFATRGLFIYAGDFIEQGGFHPVLLPHYLSDYEFSIRAARKGLTLMTSPEVRLRYDDNASLTGIRTTQGLSVLQSLRKNLSIRSTANPVYWTSFVVLAGPGRYVPINLFRVWWRFLGPVRDAVWRFFVPTRLFFAPARQFLGRIKRKIKREWIARSGAPR